MIIIILETVISIVNIIVRAIISETVISIVAGAIISIIIAHCYYKKSSEDLQAIVDKLSTQLDKLNEINATIERRQSLQLDSQCQRSEDESMQIVRQGSDYVGQCIRI